LKNDIEFAFECREREDFEGFFIGERCCGLLNERLNLIEHENELWRLEKEFTNFLLGCCGK
jgi:hypothetical protein